MSVNIEVYYGRAGTGKTHKLLELLREYESFTKVVLAPTHAAVENVRSQTDVSNTAFATLHSFFVIDPTTSFVAGCNPRKVPQYLFIDEFGMISRTIFEDCLDRLKSCVEREVKLFLFGDPLQLTPICKPDLSITFTEIDRLNNAFGSSNKCLSTHVLKHMFVSVLSTPEVMNATFHVLRENKRSNNAINELVEHIYFSNDTIDMTRFKFVSLSTVVSKIRNDGFVYIASTYRHLQKVYDRVYGQTRNVNGNPILPFRQHISENGNGFTILYLHVGMNVIATTTTPSYYNGEELIVNELGYAHGRLSYVNLQHSNGEVFRMEPLTEDGSTYYPITPANLLTVHKSQGRGFDKTIVCVNDMFEPTMMYTAITRAKNEILFFADTLQTGESNELVLHKAFSRDSFNEIRITLKLFEECV